MNYDEEQISISLRESLRNFPLYRDDHWVQVVIKDSVYVSYAPTSSRREKFFRTMFDLEVKGEVCYVNGFNVEECRRRQGNGGLLSELIEDFCANEFGCRKFITTPSGQSAEKGPDGRCFWEKQGFRYVDGVSVEKVID